MAKHSPPDDNSFQTSLVRHLGAAVALVAVVALAFWGIGQIRDDGSMTVASGPESTGTGTGDADPSPTVTATAEPAAPTVDEGTDTGDATQPPATDVATPTEDATTATAEPEPTEDPTQEPTAEATEDDAATSDGDLDPASISVQVLDATGAGDTTAAEVADELRSDGFQVVAENRAVREYEVTTVFYTPGNEAEARFIADRYGYREVAPEPGNLSHSVDVHLVVGNDA